ncbi:MAG: aminotransferase class I/II-fold pyridoxal phosphate-dependent enzyme [Actinomycetota bacterium]
MGLEVDPTQEHLATDVGVGVVEVLRVVAKPGDKVLINSPVYHNFTTWINETKLEKVDVPFQQSGSEWVLDFVEIEKAYKSGIKVHLLCSPHNPLGRVYLREELIRFAELAEKYSVVVISDEIHGPLTFSESTFVPFLTLGQSAEAVGIVVTAASKAWNIAGLKCAIIVSQSTQMNSLLKKLPSCFSLSSFATRSICNNGRILRRRSLVEFSSSDS